MLSGALNKALLMYRNRRADDVAARLDGETIRGDFKGSVKGSWVRLDDGGAGVVLYKSKEYLVKTIGFTSLVKGATVQLTYSGGVYFASF